MRSRSWQKESNNNKIPPAGYPQNFNPAVSPKSKTLSAGEGQFVFKIPDLVFPIFYSTGEAPSTSTVTLLLRTSTKPPCISK